MVRGKAPQKNDEQFYRPSGPFVKRAEKNSWESLLTYRSYADILLVVAMRVSEKKN